MEQDISNLIILAIPLLAGGIIAAINEDSVNNATEKAESWARRTQVYISKKDNWFYGYIINPILWIIIKFCDWTDSFTHRGLKNGMRIAATLYFIAAWCFLIYAVFMIAVILIIAGVIIYIIFKVLVNSNDDVKQGYEKGRNLFNTNSQKDPTDFAGLKGKKIYSGTNWFNEELKGRVDNEGNIYSGTNWFTEEKIGRIDEDGNILEGSSFFNEHKVGRIDEDGNLHKGSNWFNEQKTGRIDEDGNIHKGSNWFNEEKTGRSGV